MRNSGYNKLSVRGKQINVGIQNNNLLLLTLRQNTLPLLISNYLHYPLLCAPVI